MSRVRWYGLGLVIVSVFSFIGVNLARATDPPIPDRARLHFGAPIADSELRDLLRQYQSAPVAAYMVDSGLTGTYRAYNQPSADEFVGNARAESVESFTKSLRGSVLSSLRRFADEHAESEVVASESLQMQARSLLILRASLGNALAEARSGMPIIYAVEVAGTPAQFDRLRADARIKTLEVFSNVGDEIAAGNRPLPEIIQQEYRDPSIQEMGARELYRRIKALVSSAN